jgi:hypothetical protein
MMSTRLPRRAEPLELLLDTLKAPLAYCSCKEALLARCTAVLELEGVVDQDFYRRHLVKGAENLDALGRYDQAWAEQVIHDAIHQLTGGTVRG